MLLSHHAQHATGAGSVHVVYAIVPAIHQVAQPTKRLTPSHQFQPDVPLTSIYHVPVPERVSVPLI